VICGVIHRSDGDRWLESAGSALSEESRRQFLDPLNDDPAFLERLKARPTETLAEFDLSSTERTALATNDEDGLRRLAGQDVAGSTPPGHCPAVSGSAWPTRRARSRCLPGSPPRASGPAVASACSRLASCNECVYLRAIRPVDG